MMSNTNAGLVAGEAGGAEAVNPPGDIPMDQLELRLATRERGFRHDNTITPLAPHPGEAVEIWATTGTGLPLRGASVFYTVDGALPDLASSSVPMESVEVAWDDLAGYLTHWRAVIPAQAAGTTVRYRLGGWRGGIPSRQDGAPDVWAHDGQGFWFRFADETGVSTFAYLVESPAPCTPAWAAEAVIYHIFLDRFHPGTPDGRFAPGRGPNERHGGTLRGVIESLPYLRDLGVTCLWLSPLAPSETYHRYDATDLYGVDPALGTARDLRDLVDAAHARGMRLLLDFVPSHCSWHHPAFDAARRDRAAETASWFTFDRWPDRYRSFLQVIPSLPSFNTDDAGARAHIIGSAVQWLRDYGVDGFRLDHAIGPSMDFWVAFRSATRAVAPESFTVGEATDTPDALRRYRGRLDAVLDFPLTRALRYTFGTGHWNLARLDAFLTAHERYLSDGPGRASGLDNHDMNRFLFVAGNDMRRLKMAALCQFTLSPTPIIYYGTEIGLTQRGGIADRAFGGDAEARRDMPWDREEWDHDLLAFYRALIALRVAHPVLLSGARRTLHLDMEAGTYAYLRSGREGADGVLVVFNLGDSSHTVALTCQAGPMSATPLLSTGATPDVSVGEGSMRITLNAMTGAALRVSGS